MTVARCWLSMANVDGEPTCTGLRFNEPGGPPFDAGFEWAEFVGAATHQGAVEALESIVSIAYGASGATGDDAGHLTTVGMMAKEALKALGVSRPVSNEEDASQSRWVVGGCYEDNRLRLIEGRALGVHEQLTLVEASE
jgi:hypothetical protein